MNDYVGTKNKSALIYILFSLFCRNWAGWNVHFINESLKHKTKNFMSCLDKVDKDYIWDHQWQIKWPPRFNDDHFRNKIIIEFFSQWGKKQFSIPEFTGILPTNKQMKINKTIRVAFLCIFEIHSIYLTDSHNKQQQQQIAKNYFSIISFNIYQKNIYNCIWQQLDSNREENSKQLKHLIHFRYFCNK